MVIDPKPIHVGDTLHYGYAIYRITKASRKKIRGVDRYGVNAVFTRKELEHPDVMLVRVLYWHASGADGCRGVHP
jgi:hypothetical protein